MAKNKKVIISCAVTGAIHTPSMSEYLPVTADEVIEHSLAAHQAGAAVLHLHARDEIDGHPTQDPEEFQKFLPTIQSSCDAVINITTGGGPQMTVEDSMRPAMHFKPELASLNMGSMNFGLFPMLKKHNQLKFPWEKEMLERSKHSLFKNTFEDNLLKCGKFIPGTDIKILSTFKLKKMKPKNIIILAWNFSTEIKQKLKNLKIKNINLIIPLPKPIIVKI